MKTKAKTNTLPKGAGGQWLVVVAVVEEEEEEVGRWMESPPFSLQIAQSVLIGSLYVVSRWTLWIISWEKWFDWPGGKSGRISANKYDDKNQEED